MPKMSKVQTGSTKPKQAAPVIDERTDFYCCRCQRHFKRQKANFPASQSSLYKGNGGYLTICNHCVDELFEHYKAALGSEPDAIKRICLKFDIYWNPEIYAMLNKASTSQSRVRAYISKTNLFKYVTKTYDDTLDEEMQMKIDAEEEAERLREESIVKSVEPIYEDEHANEPIISDEVIKYWGTGFTPEMYLELESRRDYWMSQYPEGTVFSPGEEGILRQICNLEITINQDRASGKPIEKSINALNTLFGSMSIKPSQKREVEENYIPFGCEIGRWEDERPVLEIDEEFQDVDGMRKNVISWFLGSLCKTANIKNEYSKFFEDEIAKYTVERPSYDDIDIDDDDESNGGDTDD